VEEKSNIKRRGFIKYLGMNTLISKYHFLRIAKSLHRRPCAASGRALVSLALASCLTSFLAPELFAAQKIPGEEGSGLLYALTNLHPVAYVILVLVFILSVLNLLLQDLLHPETWPSSVRRLFTYGVAPDMAKRDPQSDSGRLSRVGVGFYSGMSSGDLPGYAADAHEGVVGPRRVARSNREEMEGRPTPLDGLNHPLPSFAASRSVRPEEAPPMIGGSTDKKGQKREFKFTTAVDLPPLDEMERREREKLVVSGRVMGSDGKALASALVFLTDQQGNRVGQSARSAENTGEFKAQAHEPGKYVIQAYKRGYLMENTEPLAIPVEAGRIEGIDIRMIPEGCLVQGHVEFDGPPEELTGLEARCSMESSDWSRSSRLDPSGTFRIAGVLHDSSCTLELVAGDGTVLGRTDPFDTKRNREMYRTIKVSCRAGEEREAEMASEERPWRETENSGEPPPQSYSADTCKAG